MLELLVRCVAVGIVAAVSVAAGTPPVDFTGRLGALFVAYSVLAFLLERRDLRNPGISGWIAVADAGTIALLLAKANALEGFAFLVLAPVAYAANRFGSNPAATAPLAAGSIMLAHNVSGRPTSGEILLQAAAILGVGLVMNQPRVVLSASAPPREPPTPREWDRTAVSTMELREKFRRLREYALDLERKSRRDRLAARLFEAVRAPGGNAYEKLARALRKSIGAEGLVVYTASRQGLSMVVRAFSGDVPEPLQVARLDLERGLGDWQLRHRLGRQVSAFKAPGDEQGSSVIPLKSRGRMVGLISLADRDEARLATATAKAEEISSIAGELLQEIAESENLRIRLAETELLYAVATTVQGAETPITVAARTVRELWPILALTHLSAWFIDGQRLLRIASEGTGIDPFGALKGGGEGWIVSGTPEIAIEDAHEDPRCDHVECLKRRIGSLAVIPIVFGPEPYGALVATTSAVGAIDRAELEVLRTITAELSLAIGRLEWKGRGSQGITTPREFQQALAERKGGCFVSLEPIDRDELVAQFGKPALDQALRQFAARVRAQLPVGGMLCRRYEGDFVAYLPFDDLSFAESWANQQAALASMVALTTPDGRARIPLALKARVAPFRLERSEVAESWVD